VKSRVLVAPSILSADFSNLASEIKAVESAGAEVLHLDVMDGIFVPNITFGPVVIKSLRSITDMTFDVHLMIESPERYIKEFAEAGADWISFHAEATKHLHRTLWKVKELGKKAGIALNPHTPISFVEYLLEDVDFVVVMSVNPGFGGQKFIPFCLKKIKALAEIRKEKGLKFLIEVDGGVNPETAPAVIGAGADVLVAGSAVFKNKPYEQAIARIRGF